MAPIELESLLPPGPPVPIAELLARVDPRPRATAARPYTFVNMVSSVDGRATIEGRAAKLGDEADLEMLLELRAIADAVLIGPGTLRAEGYDRLIGSSERRARRVANGLEPDPVAVVISRGLDVPWGAGLFAAPDQSVLVYTAEDAPTPVAVVAASVEIVRLPDPSPTAVFADLRARGVRALLSEGGPTLNRALLGEGLLDELFLTVAPLITALTDAPTIVMGGPLPEPVPTRLLWISQHGDELFLRYALGGR
jgi:riboflavin biosynthesis pyrimidine reductase